MQHTYSKLTKTAESLRGIVVAEFKGNVSDIVFSEDKLIFTFDVTHPEAALRMNTHWLQTEVYSVFKEDIDKFSVHLLTRGLRTAGTVVFDLSDGAFADPVNPEFMASA